MTKLRGFEVAKGFDDKEINVPIRATRTSAGYDFEAADDVIVPSIFGQYFEYNSVLAQLQKQMFTDDVSLDNYKVKPTLVHTGVKAYMADDEYLELVNRSSGPMKRGLVMSNGVGVIDSDYYENESNDGEIAFQFINIGATDYVIHKGDKVGQGIFHKFMLTDDDIPGGKREGGFGSTDK